MKQSIILILLFSVLTFFIINKKNNSPSKIAIIDMNKISKDLNFSKTFDKAILSLESKLNKSLIEEQNKLILQRKNLQKKLGSSPSDKDKKDFLKKVTEANSYYLKLKKETNSFIYNQKKNLTKNFNEEIKNITVELSDNLRLRAVLPKNIAFTFDESINITDKVIQIAIKKGLKEKYSKDIDIKSLNK